MILRDSLTLIIPFYMQPLMLGRQIEEWNKYPSGIEIIVVDDGSSQEAAPLVRELASDELLGRLSVYKILVDIPWNRSGARNLGAMQAHTRWLLHADLDHLLPAQCVEPLLSFSPDPKRWYRFERFRRGKADDTRKKDKISPEAEYGAVHPHIDSYLCTKALYWKAGGYNEDFSGCLGGGSPFLAELEKLAKPAIAPSDVFLEVYTRSVIQDSSDHTLSRDKAEFARRKAKMRGNYRGKNPIRFPWERVL